jgi:hypothetical protein
MELGLVLGKSDEEGAESIVVDKAQVTGGDCLGLFSRASSLGLITLEQDPETTTDQEAM